MNKQARAAWAARRAQPQSEPEAPVRAYNKRAIFVPREVPVDKNPNAKYPKFWAFSSHDRQTYIRTSETGVIRSLVKKARGKSARREDKARRRLERSKPQIVMDDLEACDVCGGSGGRLDGPCSACGGSGRAKSAVKEPESNDVSPVVASDDAAKQAVTP